MTPGDDLGGRSVRFLISGRVQGVGFRWWVARRAGEVGIVLSSDVGIDILSPLSNRIRKRLVPIDVDTVGADLHGKIVWGHPATFKGLEKPVVFAIGFYDVAFDKDRSNELYVAMSRCNYGLWIFMTKQLEQELERNRLENTED